MGVFSLLRTANERESRKIFYLDLAGLTWTWLGNGMGGKKSLPLYGQYPLGGWKGRDVVTNLVLLGNFFNLVVKKVVTSRDLGSDICREQAKLGRLGFH